MRIRVVLAAFAALLLVTGTAGAANRVEVQSMGCLARGDVAIGIHIENDIVAEWVTIPLIIKSINSSAYMTALTLVNPVPGSRMDGKLPDIVVSNTYPVGGVAAPGCNSAWYTDGGFNAATAGPPDYISPDGVLLARQRIFGATLSAGSDFPVGTGIPSFRLDMTVTETAGVFEIDTTCVTPANHLMWGNGQIAVPAFTKGTITICPCPWQGDFDEDGDIDAVDLARDIDIVFFGGIDMQDPGCPTTRCDWNADGFVDAVDLAKWINYVFFGGADPVNPCE